MRHNCFSEFAATEIKIPNAGTGRSAEFLCCHLAYRGNADDASRASSSSNKVATRRGGGQASGSHSTGGNTRTSAVSTIKYRFTLPRNLRRFEDCTLRFVQALEYPRAKHFSVDDRWGLYPQTIPSPLPVTALVRRSAPGQRTESPADRNRTAVQSRSHRRLGPRRIPGSRLPPVVRRMHLFDAAPGVLAGPSSPHAT